MTRRTVFLQKSNNYIERLRHFGYTPNIIMLRKFSNGKKARDLERSWLLNLSKYKYNTGLLTSGNTETFLF